MGVHSNAFYWWFYSHSMDYSTPFVVHCWDLWINSTDDSTPNLRIILLSFYWSFYSKSTDNLLACYWWFYFHSTDHSEHLLVGEEISRTRNQLTKTHVTTSTNASKTSSQWWCRFCWLMAGLANFCWEVCNWLILLVILLPFYWLYTYSTDDSIPILLTIFYWSFHSNSTDHSNGKSKQG